MILLRQIRRFCLNMSLAVLLAIAIVFNFGGLESWAATSLPEFTNQTAQIASLDRATAITKNLEGRTQEAIGNVTGDPKDQVMGKAKQVESQVRNTAEDIKDNMNVKGNAKKVERQTRNVLEDMKDKVQDVFN